MKREIKFKSYVKNKSTGEIKSYIWDVWGQSGEGDGLLTEHEECIDFGLQYTGLKDKNGKEIYEGDLLSFDTNVTQLKDVVFEVLWDNKNAEFSKWSPRDKVKIVGNIYQNQELLK